MKRLIVCDTNWTWHWAIRHFPKPGDHIEVGEGVVEEIPTLAESILPFSGVIDITVPLQRNMLPLVIEIETPGDLQPTLFHLTGEPREPYTISDSFELVICDTPIRFDSDTVINVIEAGWQSDSVNGIRIVTPDFARRKFGKAPEAFTAGEVLQATSAKPVLYVLGGGSAVWLTGRDRGLYWQDESFYDWRKAIIKVTNIVITTILAQRDTTPCAAMEQWQEHRNIPQP